MCQMPVVCLISSDLKKHRPRSKCVHRVETLFSFLFVRFRLFLWFDMHDKCNKLFRPSILIESA